MMLVRCISIRYSLKHPAVRKLFELGNDFETISIIRKLNDYNSMKDNKKHGVVYIRNRIVFFMLYIKLIK